MGGAIQISEERGVRYLHFGSHWVQGAMRMSAAAPLATTVTVPLQPGSNRVLLVARDDKEIPAQKVLWIYRRGGEGELASANRDDEEGGAP